jgi:hypothetical protein
MKKNILFLGLYTLMVISVLTYMGNPKLSDKYSPMFKSALTQSIQNMNSQKPSAQNNQNSLKLENIRVPDTTETCLGYGCPMTACYNYETCLWPTCDYNTCRTETCISQNTCSQLYTCLNYETCQYTCGQYNTCQYTCNLFSTCQYTCNLYNTCGSAETCNQYETCQMTCSSRETMHCWSSCGQDTCDTYYKNCSSNRALQQTVIDNPLDM